MSFTLVLTCARALESEELSLAELQEMGLEGVFEGEILAETAHESGLETESYVLDSGQAPHHRDWITDVRRSSAQTELTLYFPDEDSALRAKAYLEKRISDCEISTPERLPEKDWNAEWKKSFKGIDVAPFWRILPPWEIEGQLDGEPDGEKARLASPDQRVLKLNPGAGFGTGTHETTQLCLEFFGRWASGRKDFSRIKFLDFGSGSGILAIAAALHGIPVVAVEIDPLAIDNGRDNAELNQVEGLIDYQAALAPELRFDGVFANILKVVLLEYRDRIVGAWNRTGPLILSGLVDADVDPILAAYEPVCGKATEVKAKNEWRAIYWRGSEVTQ